MVELENFAIQSTNSWLPPFAVTENDFLSIDPASASMPRQADGRLPDIEFMHLRPGSDLIDAGMDVGSPYLGAAADLGAFESNPISMATHSTPDETALCLFQNYPNPFNPSTTIKYSIQTSEYVTLKVYDVLGNEVATLANEEKPAGSYEVKFDASHLSSGIYFYELKAGSFIETRKMLLLK
jgi:hypothetical protein